MFSRKASSAIRQETLALAMPLSPSSREGPEHKTSRFRAPQAPGPSKRPVGGQCPHSCARQEIGRSPPGLLGRAPHAESLFPGPRFSPHALQQPPEHHPLCRRVLGSPAPTRSPSARLGATHFQPELSLNKHGKTTHVKTIGAGPSADRERGPRPQPAWLGTSAQ